MSQRDTIMKNIREAPSLKAQASHIAALDAFDRQAAQSDADGRSWDGASAIVEATLRPVAVHERSTIETDWLGEFESSLDYGSTISAEAAAWFGRTSPEVRADREEFTEQARGYMRRQASQYGNEASNAYSHGMNYLEFLRRQAASGLPQVQQLVDSRENPAPEAMPQDAFDNFAPPIDPINQGTFGTETSERAPLLQQIEQEGGGEMGAPSHHDSTQEFEGGPAAPTQAVPGVQGTTASLTGFFTPTVAISHTATMDDFRHEGRSNLDQIQQVVDNAENPKPTPLPTEVAFPWDIDEHDEGLDERSDKKAKRVTASDYPVECYSCGKKYDNPPPRRKCTDCGSEEVHVADHPWNRGKKQSSFEPGAYQRRAAYVAGLVVKTSLTPSERAEVQAFTAGLKTLADQWSQSGPQSHGPGAANNEGTTPDLAGGRSAGQQDWEAGAHPTFADASSSVPKGVQEYSQGYADQAKSDPNPVGSGAPAGQMPPGAGGFGNGYETHAASLSPVVASFLAEAGVIEAKMVSCSTCGTKDQSFNMRQRGNGTSVNYQCTNCAPTSPTHGQSDPFSKAPVGRSAMRVSASFATPVEYADPDFAKAYKYASKWKPTTRLVSQGSAAFEAGLYAGISDNHHANQKAWVAKHAKAEKFGPEYAQRIRLHESFTQKVASTVPGMSVQGAYLKQAATSSELDTMDGSASPSPTGSTPINGPGTTPPLAGGSDPAAPGGPSPYNGAEPFGTPVAPMSPTSGAPTGSGPQTVDTTVGGPMDQAAQQRMSPQTLAFRQKVASNRQAAMLPFGGRTAAAEEKKYPVCRGCGESFDNKEVAHDVHGKMGCGTETGERGYEMKRESEAW